MKNSKKLLKLSILLFTFLTIIALSNKANASSSDLYLNNLNFDAKINSDGSMDVIETWNIDIEDTNTLFKTFKTDKTKYSGIDNVKVTQITKDGTTKTLKKINELMYHVTKDCYYGMQNEDGDFEIAWGVGLDSDSERRTYKISYTVEDAIKNCEDCSELYWQFVGKDFEISAKKITGKITLPENAKNKEDIKIWGHTEDLNGELHTTSTNTVEFDINGFKSGRYVEIRIAIPEEIGIYSSRSDANLSVQDMIKEETKWADEANARRERKVNGIRNIIIVITLIIAGLDILLIRNAKKNKQKYNELPEKIRPSQEIIYYRDLPDENATPAEALRMLNKKLTDLYSTEVGNIFSATLLDLSLKGLISFRSEEGTFGKTKIRIIIENKDTSAIENQEDELEIYKFVKRAADSKDGTITAKELSKYIERHESSVLSLKGKLDRTTLAKVYEKGYVDKKNKNESDSNSAFIILYLMISIIAFVATIVIPALIFKEFDIGKIFKNIFMISSVILVILSIINLVIKSKIGSKINVFTQEGVDKISQWKGLKKFMEEFSMMDKKEVPEVVIWEKYLVYATAFGIADKVLKQLKIVYPEITQMDNFNTGIYMGLMLNTDFSSSFSHSISSAMSSSYSSGSGGGGGFSGGGGFGGGRRPEAVEDKLPQNQKQPKNTFCIFGCF